MDMVIRWGIHAWVVASLFLIAPARAETLVFQASEAGKESLDQGEGGGNPFASSLIEILAQPRLELSELPATLKKLTSSKSRGFQSAVAPASIANQNFMLVPPRQGERRIALVMVVSDYTLSGGAPSLPGAQHDAERITLALRRAGFATDLALNLDLRSMREKLGAFKSLSKDADAAVIYTTGHGVEVGGAIFLMPGDYPIGQRAVALKKRALPLSEIVQSPQAKQVNLVFYGGCRDNPFSP